MNQPLASPSSLRFGIASVKTRYWLWIFCSGLLIPLGFAPFHLPGLTLLGIAFFFAQLRQPSNPNSFLTGFIFGLGFFGLGVSWIFVSIHEYGHLNSVLSALITTLFIIYLALFIGLVATLFSKLNTACSSLQSCFLFSAMWCLGEYFRATFLTGFPWLLLGFGQIDSPLKYLLPIVGVYGVSFLSCLAAAFLVKSIELSSQYRTLWLGAFVSVLLLPSALHRTTWANQSDTPISVGVIQANLSMRDKWDEALFWQLLRQYKNGIDHFVGKKQLIVMPESAIPVPANYVTDFIDTLQIEAKQNNSAILLGIPEATNSDETHYFNTVTAIGDAEGRYLKQHLVPFGEFIPEPFTKLAHWLDIPLANLKPGQRNQPLIQVQNHPIASLICYELAYPELLRKQLPLAEWIVSISDDGWFGHSLAMYQQLQMAQVLSLQTARFQIMANNDGLSSVIDTEGNITASLPAFSPGLLEASLFPATGQTPWVRYGDLPVLVFCILMIIYLSNRRSKRSFRCTSSP